MNSKTNYKKPNDRDSLCNAVLGVVLSRDEHVSVDELKQLVEETETAAAELTVAAQAYKTASLDLDCADPVAADHKQKELMSERQRLEMVKPRLQERLAAAVRRERRETWEADFRRVEAKLEKAAENFATRVPAIIDELISIFQQAKAVDQEVDRVNGSAVGSERLQYCELAARNLDRHTRDMPSLAEVTTLFDFKQSSKQIWPPPRQSIGLLLTESMPPVRDPRYTADWASAYDERRAEQEAEPQRVAKFYEDQQKAREQREAREDALAAAERQRQGYP
jgi:hypothetical protein